MANIQISVEDVLASTERDITPYRIFLVLRSEIEKVDADRAALLRPQMLYNYSRNGLIVSGFKPTGTNARYTADEVRAFVAKWLKKNLKVQVSFEAPVQTPSDLIKKYRAEIGR
jgi:hypothetical protein